MDLHTALDVLGNNVPRVQRHKWVVSPALHSARDADRALANGAPPGGVLDALHSLGVPEAEARAMLKRHVTGDVLHYLMRSSRYQSLPFATPPLESHDEPLVAVLSAAWPDSGPDDPAPPITVLTAKRSERKVAELLHHAFGIHYIDALVLVRSVPSATQASLQELQAVVERLHRHGFSD